MFFIIPKQKSEKNSRAKIATPQFKAHYNLEELVIYNGNEREVKIFPKKQKIL